MARLQQAAMRTLLALARSRGYEIVNREHLKGIDRLAFAELVRRQFDRLKIGCVLDVGANRGQYRDFLRNRISYTGRIVSFEPIADLATGLRERASAKDPAWEVCPYALGAAEEHRKLHVMRAKDYSSFLRPTDVAVRDDFARKNVVERMETVVVRRLDDVVADGLLLGPGGVWLKADTQGWDLEVIRGAAQTLPSISALQIELSVLPIYKGMPDYLMALSELRRFGFGVVALAPVNRDPLGRVIEFDCVLVAASDRGRAHSNLAPRSEGSLARLAHV